MIRAGALQGYQALMRELGVDPLPLLQRNGIDFSILEDTENLISLNATIQLLEDSATLARCPDFGLRLARYQDMSMLGLLAIVIQNAATIAQAMEDASRFLFLHSPAFEVVPDDRSSLFEDCTTLRFEIHIPTSVQQRQMLEGGLAHTYRLARMLVGDPFRLRAVSLPHAPLASKIAYSKFFDAPVYFSQHFAGLHVHRDVLQADLRPVNPILRQLALNYIAQQFPPRVLQLSDRVRHTLSRTLGANRGTKSEIAWLLGMHPRTLQRRLDQEGLTFEAIREDVYRNAAWRFLRETDVPLKQLAGALGFSEQSALTRSCRRWFGAAPSQIRLGVYAPDSDRKS